MRRTTRGTDVFLTVIVLVHLTVTVLHGRAHVGAVVPVSTAANLFIIGVIVIAPIVGVGLLWFVSAAGGAWLLALSLTGAFLFGLVNHFLLESPDHVANIAADWRMLFGITAVLLALTEALGGSVAFWRASHARVR